VAERTVLARIDDRNEISQAQADIDNINAEIAAQQPRIDQSAKQVAEAPAVLAFQILFSRRAGTVRRPIAGDRHVDVATGRPSMNASSGGFIMAQQASPDLQQKQAALDAAGAARAPRPRIFRGCFEGAVEGRVTRLAATVDAPIGRYASGQPVNIEIDAYNRTFPGRVDGLGLPGGHDASRLLQHLHCWRLGRSGQGAAAA
jgi:membrane fusion protein, multidrug efflux system